MSTILNWWRALPSTRFSPKRLEGKTLHLLLLGLALVSPLRAANPAPLPDTCYLFAYFYHDREGEGFRLAWSPDGKKFEMLNEGRTCLKPTIGEGKVMRDPCLYQGPDGLWHLVWTTAWSGRTIGHATSKDLIRWSEQQVIPAMMHEAEAQNCWAPELIWDAAKQHYLIFWSSTILGRFQETANSNNGPTRNHRIYATTTKDFKTFTPPTLMYDGGFNVIDANVIPAADGTNDWLMFVKDETFAPVTQKNIRMIRGRSPEGPWDSVSAPLTGNYWAEGPSAIKVGDEYRVYFDKHRLNAIGLVTSRDLKTWTDVSDQVVFPKDARHGCIIAVPREVIERLKTGFPPLGYPAVVSAEIINPGAPYPECHASTLVELAPGQLGAAWFGGTKERNPDVGIWFARQEGGKWQPGVEVANGILSEAEAAALRQAQGNKAVASRLPCWNPVLFQPKNGPLTLFYKIGPSPSTWWGMVITSTDGGKTWSAPRRLPDGILGPIKNKPVQLADGAWLSPTSTEGNKDGWLVHFEMSRDQGATWEKIGPVKKGPGFDAIQPSILFHKNGALQALCRTKQGVVAQTWSKDGGKTWSALTAIDLPNPNSGTDAVTLADGRQLLVYNHSGHRADEAKGDRWPLGVAISDDGVTWRRSVTLETEPRTSGYAYPAVIQAADGKVHITYTFGRQVIKHVVLDPTKL